MMPHPAVRFLLWGATAVAAQFAAGFPLVVLLVVVSTFATALARSRFVRLLRRTRWLLLAIALLFAWATPGVLLLPDLGWLSPSADGLRLGATHFARLVIVLASLSLLLEYTPPDEFVGALFGLMAPLEAIGIDRGRVAVRLMLVMRYAESARARRWRDWLDPAAADEEPDVITLKRTRLRAGDGFVMALLALLAVLAFAA
jgi:energy-coupling factor transporter transmembrane protein EcfT